MRARGAHKGQAHKGSAHKGPGGPNSIKTNHNVGTYNVAVLRARSARSERSEPRERSEACSERSDEVCDCRLHIAQTKARK